MIAYAPRKILASAPASSNHLSDDPADTYAIGSASDVSLFNSGLVQVEWSGLGGTIDGVLSVEVSANKTKWDPKLIGGSPAQITVSGATGQDTIAFSETLNEPYYRVRWTKNGVNAGTITVILSAKG